MRPVGLQVLRALSAPVPAKLRRARGTAAVALGARGAHPAAAPRRLHVDWRIDALGVHGDRAAGTREQRAWRDIDGAAELTDWRWAVKAWAVRHRAERQPRHHLQLLAVQHGQLRAHLG